MRHGKVVSQVDDALSIVIVRRHVIRVFHEREKGVTGIIDIQPIDIGEWTIQHQHSAVGAVRLQRSILPLVLTLEFLRQIDRELGRQGRDDTIESLLTCARSNRQSSVVMWFDRRHFGRRSMPCRRVLRCATTRESYNCWKPPRRYPSDVLRKCVLAQNHGMAISDARSPNLERSRGLPQNLKDALTHVAADPRFGGRVFESVIIGFTAQIEQSNPESETVHERQRGKSK